LIGPRAYPIFLLVLCGLLFFLGLGTLGLTDRDEGSNAEAAREMLQSGDWITPTLNGVPRFAKPAFLYWLISTSYRLFGVSEVTARLPSAIFGTGLVLMQYVFAKQFFGPVTALRAAVILLMNFEILGIGRLVLTDMVLTFFTTLSIFSFFLALAGEDRAKRWYWVFYIAMAAGTLTKGPLGILIPLLAILPFLLLIRPWQQGRRVLDECHPIAGMVVFLAIAVPWYAAMFYLHGAGYMASARGDTVTRFFSVIGGHGGTIFFYIPVLFLGFFPWSGFLPAALMESLRGSRGVQLQNQVRSVQVLCSVWIISVFVFFSLSSTRLPHYIAPLFPAASLLVARWWDRLQSGETAKNRWPVWLTLGLGGILGVAFIGIDWAYQYFNDQIAREFPIATQIDPGWSPMAIGFLVLVGTGLFGLAALDGRPAFSFTIATGLMIAVFIVAIIVTLPRFNTYFTAPPQELAAIAGLNLDPADTLVSYGRPKPSLLFYAKRNCTAGKPCIETIKPGEEDRMKELLARPGQIMIVTQEHLRPQLPSPASNYPIVLKRHGYVLLAKNPTL
jgi:4-amino-4-deoxy-L-arabinose transferase-like glycosyltransferase